MTKGGHSPLARATLRAIHEHNLIVPGGTVVVAVSGGVDSVVLLHLLLELADDLGITLHAAHLNHDLRGDESDADQRFVEKHCKRLGVAVTSAKRRPEAGPHESPQAAARRVRYGFLNEVAEQTGAAAIATAHHADDVAESLIMRLITGAGAAGLAGMAIRRERLIRPLLDRRKQELVDHAKTHDIPYRHDASNDSGRYLRNRIRQEVMPVLAQFNPNLVPTLTRQAALLADEEQYLAAAAAEVSLGWTSADGADLMLDTERLAGLPAALCRRAVHRVLLDILPVRPEMRHVEAVRDLVSGAAGRRVNLPGGMMAVAEYGTLRIGPAPEPVVASPVPLAVPGRTGVPWADMALETATEPPGDLGWIGFDLDRMDGPLSVRARKKGDRFYPAGMDGHRQKLKDFFIAQKVPRDARDTVPLLCTGNRIAWVVSMRADGRFLADAATRNWLWVRVAPGPALQI